MGILRDLSSLIFRSSLSTQRTLWPRSARQAPVMRPTWPVPMIETFMSEVLSWSRAGSAVARDVSLFAGPEQMTPTLPRRAQEFRHQGDQEAVLVAGEFPLEDRFD